MYLMHTLTLVGLTAIASLACGEAADAGGTEFLPTDEALATKADNATESQVEIKFTLPTAQVKKALSAFGLSDKKATTRGVTFYDDVDLGLFEAGLVLRSRKVKNGADDSTAKVRPLEAGDVDPSWFELEGWKCEEDRVGSKSVQSCSLTAPQDEGEIDDVSNGERAVWKLYSDNQELFAMSYGTDFEWDDLVALGPTDTRVWKVRVKGFERELTFERWFLPDGELLEVSSKVGLAEAGGVQAKLATFLAKKGFDTTQTQETKTRRALEAYAAELR